MGSSGGGSSGWCSAGSSFGGSAAPGSAAVIGSASGDSFRASFFGVFGSGVGVRASSFGIFGFGDGDGVRASSFGVFGFGDGDGVRASFGVFGFGNGSGVRASSFGGVSGGLGRILCRIEELEHGFVIMENEADIGRSFSSSSRCFCGRIVSSMRSWASWMLSSAGIQVTPSCIFATSQAALLIATFTYSRFQKAAAMRASVVSLKEE